MKNGGESSSMYGDELAHGTHVALSAYACWRYATVYNAIER